MVLVTLPASSRNASTEGGDADSNAAGSARSAAAVGLCSEDDLPSGDDAVGEMASAARVGENKSALANKFVAGDAEAICNPSGTARCKPVAGVATPWEGPRCEAAGSAEEEADPPGSRPGAKGGRSADGIVGAAAGAAASAASSSTAPVSVSNFTPAPGAIGENAGGGNAIGCAGSWAGSSEGSIISGSAVSTVRNSLSPATS
jgi:hypothetical protein